MKFVLKSLIHSVSSMVTMVGQAASFTALVTPTAMIASAARDEINLQHVIENNLPKQTARVFQTASEQNPLANILPPKLSEDTYTALENLSDSMTLYESIQTITEMPSRSIASDHELVKTISQELATALPVTSANSIKLATTIQTQSVKPIQRLLDTKATSPVQKLAEVATKLKSDLVPLLGGFTLAPNKPSEPAPVEVAQTPAPKTTPAPVVSPTPEPTATPDEVQLPALTPTPSPTPTLLTSLPDGYMKCAKEWSGSTICDFTGSVNLYYGLNGQYYAKQISGPFDCNSGNDVLGDPVYGTEKECYVPASSMSVKIGTCLIDPTTKVDLQSVMNSDQVFVDDIRSSLVAPDGSVYLLGRNSDNWKIQKLDPQGNRNSSFGSGSLLSLGITEDSQPRMALTSRGQLIVASLEVYGYLIRFRRFSTSGSLDIGFGSRGSQLTYNILQSDLLTLRVLTEGSVVALTAARGYNSLRLTSLTSTGAISSDFAYAGWRSTAITYNSSRASAVDLVEVNSSLFVSTADSSKKLQLWKMDATGALDNQFGSSGSLSLDLSAEEDRATVLSDASGNQIVVSTYGKNTEHGSFSNKKSIQINTQVITDINASSNTQFCAFNKAQNY